MAPLEQQGVQLAEIPEGDSDAQLRHVLGDLQRRGLHHVFCEGGAKLATALLRADLVDRLDLVQAPKLLGLGTAALGDLGVTSIDAALSWHVDELHRVGEDLHIAARRARPRT